MLLCKVLPTSFVAIYEDDLVLKPWQILHIQLLYFQSLNRKVILQFRPEHSLAVLSLFLTNVLLFWGISYFYL